MIQINLLPVKEITRRIKAKKQIISFSILFLLVLAVLGGFAFVQAGMIKDREATLANLQKEQRKYTRIIQRIKQLEKDQKLLETRIGIIKKLKQSSSLTVHALDEVARLTPSKRMWLTTFSQNGSNLSVAGMALDNRTVAKYMDDLKSSAYIKNVRLSSSSLKAFAGRNLKAFAISCSIAVPQEPKSPQTKSK